MIDRKPELDTELPHPSVSGVVESRDFTRLPEQNTIFDNMMDEAGGDYRSARSKRVSDSGRDPDSSSPVIIGGKAIGKTQ
jgi:hypothetical protein